jgi:hypothetical protein
MHKKVLDIYAHTHHRCLAILGSGHFRHLPVIRIDGGEVDDLATDNTVRKYESLGMFEIDVRACEMLSLFRCYIYTPTCFDNNTSHLYMPCVSLSLDSAVCCLSVAAVLR